MFSQLVHLVADPSKPAIFGPSAQLGEALLQIHLLQSLSADYRMHFNELFQVRSDQQWRFGCANVKGVF